MRNWPWQMISDQKGIAAVEFALIAPMLLVAYLGATDLTQALAIDRKLTQISATVADLVAQEDEITRSEVHGFFEAGKAIMRPFPFERTGLRLTIVEVDGSRSDVTGATALNWTIEAGNGDRYALDDEVMILADDRYAVVASATYSYEPLFGNVFSAIFNLEQRAVSVVRKDVEDFGFEMSEDDRGLVEPGDGGDDTSSGGGNCAGNSGGNGQGNNCNNNNNSHGNKGGGNNGRGNNGGG